MLPDEDTEKNPCIHSTWPCVENAKINEILVKFQFNLI